MKTLTGVILIVGLVTGSGVRAQGLSPSEIFTKAAPTIVTVHAADASGAEAMQGSGVVIRPRVVVSNCHVIKSAASVQVGVNEVRHRASLLHADPDRDLCSLSVATLNAPVAQIGDSTGLAIGSKVYAIGAPRGLTLTLTDGLLSAKRGGLLQVSAAVSPGSSGGGLFNDLGQLVGITTLHLKDSQQLNFAVPVSWVLALPSRDQGVASVIDPVEEARAQLNAWDAQMAEADPYYTQRRDELSKQVATIRATRPPSIWLSESQIAYQALSATNNAVYRCMKDGIASYDRRYLAGHDCKPISSFSKAPDDRWLSLGIAASGAKVELDTQSMSRGGDYGGAWIRHAEPPDETWLTYYSVRCSTRTYSLTESAIRNSSGRTQHRTMSGDWERAIPSSLGESVVEAICQR